MARAAKSAGCAPGRSEGMGAQKNPETGPRDRLPYSAYGVRRPRKRPLVEGEGSQPTEATTLLGLRGAVRWTASFLIATGALRLSVALQLQ